jgi:hypothetical protein
MKKSFRPTDVLFIKKLLIEVQASIATLSPEDLMRLATGSYRIKLSIELKHADQKATQKEAQQSVEQLEAFLADDVTSLIEKIGRFVSRDEAVDFMTRSNFSRVVHENIARQVGVQMSKKDVSGKRIEKIVEALVGARLVSGAVRGKD